MEANRNPEPVATGPAPQVLHLVRRLKAFYADFSADNLAQLDAIYTQDAEFRDPVHTLHGTLALKGYLRRMATNLLAYRMRYLDEQVEPESAWFLWELDFAHRHLKGGKTITVRGMTRVRYTGKVYYHEDCYDLGGLLYEHVPVLGPLIRGLRSRMARQK